MNISVRISFEINVWLTNMFGFLEYNERGKMRPMNECVFLTFFIGLDFGG